MITLKVIMDSGTELIFTVDSFGWFEEKVTDNKGQLLNQFVDIAGTVIVPTHISVIVEHIEPKSDFIA